MSEIEIEYAHRLLVKAKSDFTALQNMTDDVGFSDDIFGFHAQQAIEKAIKAHIASRGISFPITHNLSVLKNLINDVKLSDLVSDVEQLTLFAVIARYPYDVLMELTESRESII